MAPDRAPDLPAPNLIARFRDDLIALTGCAPTSDARLGIAVSGGPDSVALLLLAEAAFPGAIAAATVDHGLRPEAADEARFVAALCADRAIPHATLREDMAPATPGRRGSQSWARALRYSLLGLWAADQGIGWIATAHHADDQAETLLMRASRGTGLSGLSSIRPTSTIGGLAVVRPLLGWRRAALARIVADAAIEPADDPSNRNPAYDRTVYRALLAANPRLDAERIAATAAHLGEADDAIEWSVGRLWDERATATDEAVALDVAGVPREYRRRLLRRALDHLDRANDSQDGFRLDALDRLLTRLDRGASGTIGRFLARPGPIWRIVPAPPRRNP